MKQFDVLMKLENGDLLWMAAAATSSEAERAAKKAAAARNSPFVVLNRETGVVLKQVRETGGSTS